MTHDQPVGQALIDEVLIGVLLLCVVLALVVVVSRVRIHRTIAATAQRLAPLRPSLLAVGGILEWLTRRHLRAAPEARRESARRRGVLLASGFLVGESVAGMLLAAVEGAAGKSFPLAVVGPDFAGTAAWIGLAGFSVAAVALYRLVVSTR